jgi:hypothetical protein
MDPAIPVSEFTQEALRLNLNMIMLSTLTVLEFECRQRTPDFRAIARLLGQRFKYRRRYTARRSFALPGEL